jgi:NitT/TauT family transport system permease protein
LGAVRRHATTGLALPRLIHSRPVDADEPFAALDAFTREELWCVPPRPLAEARFTVILVTHDRREAGVPRRQDPRHERAARTHRHDQDGRSAAPRDLDICFEPRFTDIVHELRAKIARGAKGMSTTLEKLSPWLFTIGPVRAVGARLPHFQVDTFVLPAPSQIFEAAVRYWSPLLKNSFVTLWTTLAGFALAVAFGIVLGIVVGWSRAIYRGLYPVMIGFNSIPKVAVVPILIIWFGIGVVPAILTAFLISFFPIVVNVATGLATMEPELEDVLRALGAKKLDIMLKVGIPRTQPYLFASFKVAITLAFIGAVMSETIGANAGLGHLMVQAGSNFQMPLVFACLLGLAIEGIAMYAVFAYVEARFTRWAFRSSMSAAA